jgi:hypothetical protein
VRVVATPTAHSDAAKEVVSFDAKGRIDTPGEADDYRNGGSNVVKLGGDGFPDHHADPASAPLSSSSSSVMNLHILPPTALALLSPDICEIMVFADRRAISLPRYSSLHAMMQHLQLLTI